MSEITLTPSGPGYVLEARMEIPAPVEEVFAFFSRAENLEIITPPILHFSFVTPPPETVTPGARIAYRIRIHGIPVRWLTEIPVWEPPYRFVDVQRKGPYRTWVHEHRFEPVDGGTRMTDRVYYELPLGVLGRLAHVLFVRRDVLDIFRYRQAAIRKLFTGP